MAPLFRRLLGPEMDALPPVVRAVHDTDRDVLLAGTADIEGSRNPLARLLCRSMGLPTPGTDVPATVHFVRQGARETWRRSFGGRRYASRLYAKDGLLIERMGLVTNIFRIVATKDVLHLDLVGFRVLGLPMPRPLRPQCAARESEDDRAFTFDIPISLPWLGPVLRYSGRLVPVERPLP